MNLQDDRQEKTRRFTATVLALIDQAIVSGVSFLTAVLIGRGTSPDELGLYQLGLSILLILRGVQAELVTSPFTIYQHRIPESKRATYVGSTLVHQGLTSVVVLAGLVVVAVVTSFGVGPEHFSIVAATLVIAGPLILSRDFMRQFSFATSNVRWAVALDAVCGTFQIGVLYWLFQSSGLSAIRTFVVIGGGAFLGGVVWLVGGRPRYELDRRQVVEDWKSNWRFSRWAVASQLICSCTPYLLPWFVAELRSVAETGRLAACITLIGISSMFTTALGNLLTPRAAREFVRSGRVGLSRVIRNTVTLFLIGHGVFCVAVYFAGDLLPTTVYGPSFAGMGAACLIVAISNLVNSLSVASGNWLWAVDRPHLNLPADVVSNVVTIAVACSLVPSHGAIGAAIGSLSGVSAGTSVRWWMVRRIWRELE